jgi:hypothetical protein
MELDVDSFLEELQQEVQLYAEQDESNLSLASAFTAWASEILIDAGLFDDLTHVVYESRGMALSAYSFDSESSNLDLIIIDYQPTLKPRLITRAEVESGLKRVAAFATKAQAGKLDVDPAHAISDLVELLQGNWESLNEVRIRYLSNGLAKESKLEIEFPNVRVKTDVWDLERFYKLANSGKLQESIEVNLANYGDRVKCIGPFANGADYRAYFAVFSGEVLASIYDDFGPRLLELNVRSFLQARGKVNKGLQDTIKNQPKNFLAFNNGIVITSSEVAVERSSDGQLYITSLKDLQIVNGGQTTASLYHAKYKGRLDISSIEIQAKIAVINPEVIDELVPLVSKFANSQNTIKTADFSANDPFHVEIERLSRSIWAPSPDGGHVMTKWFYERARGQYSDALGRERTPAKQRDFKKNHPPNQKFTKTDLAKYELIWDQRPFLVALGAEKAFREFTLIQSEKGNLLPSNSYFEGLVSKAILYRHGEKIVTSLQLGGYRSQTLIYTLALIVAKTQQGIDLQRIWAQQKIYAELEAAIVHLAPQIRDLLISSAGSRNVTEWAKKEEFWKLVKQVNWEPREGVVVTRTKHTASTQVSSSDLNSDFIDQEFDEAIEAIKLIDPDMWKALAAWAKETSNLQPWQRGLAFSIGNLLVANRPLSRKQAIQGLKIIDEAKRLGFLP